MEEQKNFLDLVKQLAETQVILSKINAQLAIRKGKDQIGKVMSNTITKIEQQAKIYGANLKKIEDQYKANKNKKGILGEYKETIETINNEYMPLLEGILNMQISLEATEQRIMMELENERQEKINSEVEKSWREEYRKIISDGTYKNAKNPSEVFDINNLQNEIYKRDVDPVVDKILGKEDLTKDSNSAEEKFNIVEEVWKREEEENEKDPTKRELYEKLALTRIDMAVEEILEEEKENKNRFEGPKKEEELKEVRALIEECKTEYKNVIKEREETIEKETADKDNKLAVIPKQNLFQKAIGAIFNKFNGTKKFMKSTITPLKEKITNLKEEKIPQIKEEVANKKNYLTKNFKNKISNIKNNIIGKTVKAKDAVKDKAETVAIYGLEAMDKVKGKAETAAIYGLEAKDKVKSGLETIGIYGLEATGAVKGGFLTVIQKGKEVKANQIARAEGNLRKRQEEIERKKALLKQQDNEKDSEKATIKKDNDIESVK